MKRAVCVALLAFGMLPLAGCTRINDSRQTLLGIVDATERSARTYTATEVASGHTTVVRTTITDDLSFALSESVDQSPVADEVVLDDRRALRVQDPGVLDRMVRSSASPSSTGPLVDAGASPTPSASPSPSASPAPGATATSPLNSQGAPEALTQGRWVVDARGASGLSALPVPTYALGTDPIFDSLQLLGHLREAINQADSVQLFNPEATGYQANKDPFPAPADGIDRYDALAPALAPHDPATGGAGLPDTRYFRRLAVYVKAGIVVQVRERVSVEATMAEPASHVASRIGDYAIPIPTGASIHDQATAVLAALNQRLGPKAIRERTLDVVFGQGGPAVVIPDGAVAGDLSHVANHGLVLFQQT